MLQVQSPLQQFFDVDGSPLEAGYVYIGVSGQNPETNPLTVYWDNAATIPAAQPIRTEAGYIVRYGTPGRLYTTAENFSMTVRDKKGRLVFSVMDATSVSNLQDLITGSGGSAVVGYVGSGTGAIVTNVQRKLRERVSVFDFMTDTEIADVQARTLSKDVTAAIQKAIDSLTSAGGLIYFPPGAYSVTGQISVTNKSNVHLQGVGFSGSYNATNYGTTILANGSFTVFQFTNGVGCTVEGLQIRGGGSALDFNACLGFRVVGCNLRDNQIGATFFGNGVGVVQGNMVRDNTVAGLRFLKSSGDSVVTENDIGGNPYGIYVASGGVHIHNNMIFYSNNGSGTGAGVMINAQDANADDPIRHCFITNNLLGRNDTAVVIQGDSLAYPTVESVIITENRIHQADDGGGTFDPGFAYGYGISVTWAKWVSIKNNNFAGMRGYAVSGFQCESGIYVEGNSIRYGSDKGVVFNDVQWGRVQDNNFIGNTGTAIQLKCDLLSSFTQNNIIKGNTFQSNGAVYVESDVRTRANLVIDNLGGTLGDYSLSAATPATQLRHVVQGGNQETLSNQTLSLSNSAWNGSRLVLGSFNFWVSNTAPNAGKLMIKNGTPSSDNDGIVVGSQ